MHVLAQELFGRGLILPEFPRRPDIIGIGLSDWQGYAARLAERLTYTNTYYHMEPKLDITVAAPERENTLDFLISSEVLEHVTPPVAVAFEQSRRLLKPGGVLVLSVPYGKGSEHEEHYPDLHDYEVEEHDGGTLVKNVTRDGIQQLFDNPVFHGGTGTVLEMRVFSEASLIGLLQASGFTDIHIYHEPVFEYGIYWPHDWSLPISARRA